MGEAIDEGVVRAAVARVWREEVPRLRFDEALTWRDAGVDSLQTLHILLKLEQALGRPISFDLFTLDSSLGEVIGVLGAQAAAPLAAPADARAQVFVLPGIKGDDLNLAGFRHALAIHARCESLDYPGLDAPARVHGDLQLQTDLVVAEIGRRQPDGPICLAGYSFGGLLAFEAARRLTGSGREIGLVVLLDTFAGPKTPGAWDRPPGARRRYPILPRLAARPGEGPLGYVERLVFQGLVKYRRLDAARRLANWSRGHTPIEETDARRRRLLELMRLRAMDQWRPAPLAAPVLLITSDDYYTWSNTEVWPAVCANLTEIRVGGSHMEIFGPEALDRYLPAVVAGIAEATQSRPGSCLTDQASIASSRVRSGL
jgi:thioesterase domain-containing protein/acyl carrier protein